MDLRFKKLFENIFLTQRNAKGRNFHVNMRKMNLLWMFAAMAAMWVSCGTPETEQSGRPGDGGASVSGNGGYLFVHMTDQNYGRMFYSVSRDK